MIRFSRKVLLVDIDNTLYDWVRFFVPSFRSMVVEISRMSGIPIPILLEDFGKVYKKHGSVEYSFAIEELETLRDLHPDMDPIQRVKHYWGAIKTFQTTRKKLLKPYNGIPEMLYTLNRHGIGIYAISESMDWHAKTKLKSLNLDTYFKAIYTIPDRIPHDDFPLDEIRKFPLDEYIPENIIARLIPVNARKPDPIILSTILQELDLRPSEVVYLGDNLFKDVKMARDCGVFSAWAKYGTYIDPIDYRTLLKITPWTLKEIDESKPISEVIVPDLVVDNPRQVLDLFWIIGEDIGSTLFEPA